MRLAVVGGGVTGLTAAYRARQALGASAHIDVFDRAETPGGTLRTVRLAQQWVDVGAEAFLVRRPEVPALIAELGLADQVVTPSGMRPSVYSGGRVHPLPAPAVMGIPAAADPVRELADTADLQRIAEEPNRRMDWPAGTDLSVGALVQQRFGPSIVARSVDPMLGGVYSARSREIGVREALPALAQRLDDGAPSLSAAVRTLLPQSGGGPVFGALRGGYRTLVSALWAAARARWHTADITGLSRSDTTWQVLGPELDATDYDAVVVALPPPSAASVLAGVVPEAAALLGDVAMAGSALVSLALPRATVLPEHSGVLVATGEALGAKAFTFTSRKWPHYDDQAVLVRASFGRFGAPVTSSDEDLVTAALADLGRVCESAGVAAVGTPVDAVVQRWPQGLPVYAPGHARAMRAVLADRPAGLALAGAAYQGVGVPACIASARAAVDAVLADLGSSGTMDS